MSLEPQTQNSLLISSETKQFPFIWVLIAILVLIWIGVPFPVGIQLQWPTSSTLLLYPTLYNTINSTAFCWGITSSINAIVNSLYPQSPWQIVTFICLELVFWITIGLLICSALNWRKKGDIWMRCALIGECVIIFGAFYQILITILMFHLQIVDIPLEINSTAQILLGPVVWEFIAIFIISLLGWRFILNKAPASVNHPTFIQRYSQFFPIVLGCAIIFLSLLQKIGNLDFYYVNNSDTSLYLWGGIQGNLTFTFLGFGDIFEFFVSLIFLLPITTGIYLILCGFPKISFLIIKKLMKLAFFQMAVEIGLLIIIFFGFYSLNLIIPIIALVEFLIWGYYRKIFLKKKKAV